MKLWNPSRLMFFVYFGVVPLVCGLNAVLRCWFQCVIIRYTRVDDESANQAWLRLALRFCLCIRVALFGVLVSISTSMIILDRLKM